MSNGRLAPGMHSPSGEVSEPTESARVLPLQAIALRQNGNQTSGGLHYIGQVTHIGIATGLQCPYRE